MPPHPRFDRDTQLCMSLAARPGNFGTRFHNFLYELLDLNYVYKAFTTGDLPAAIGGVRALGIRGCALSMPFKEAVIPLVDELMPSAAAISSVNTVVNDGGHLRAYNTDYQAVADLIRERQLDPGWTVSLRGSGGMGKAVAQALADAGFRGVIVARNERAGRALAERLGWGWSPGPQEADLLVNVTPIGMAGGEGAGELSYPPELIGGAQAVFDVVARPAQTPLIAEAQWRGKPVLTGLDVIGRQALEQFVLYTGVRPDPAQVAQAVAFAQGGEG